MHSALTITAQVMERNLYGYKYKKLSEVHRPTGFEDFQLNFL
jgi:hypothetical protein